MKLRFVTGNEGKVREASELLGRRGITVIGVRRPVVEIQAESLDVIACAKAESLRKRVPAPYFVEDAGLFVDALNGFPGPYSAFVNATIGWQGLLRLMRDQSNRGAAFRAVIALVEGPSRARVFSGECRGRISRKGVGDQGFGFDPVFIPAGRRVTFAQMPLVEKSARSHRGQALGRLAKHLGRRL